ncbi:hypothetical protein AYL99_07472 [Fonsecaea erecta]|uniref:ABM domain-containing protein n=1 Tax=Fonsecaea erecta TaxID=1367422 RepID=A0A178ZFG6_9EURO|nr:hypothetical protein AYL99_07472 [Fonsecaea erecta]OAP58382.1 hypothetical protein AYL99_07472 [Fonsecaea erecta]
MLPSILILGARLADTLAVTYGLKRNPYLKDAIMKRNSPQIPDGNGNFHEEAAHEKVVVFLLGLKLNHPLGIFSHNAKTLVDYVAKFEKELETKAPEGGYYGGTNWTNQEQNGATEAVLISYWRSIEDIHEFAYGPTHREAWDWWNRTVAENDHIGINHEIFGVDQKQWEGIYINFQPTLLGATTYLRKGDKFIGGKVDDQWINPLMDASKGKLRSSAGRLGRNPTQLYEKHGLGPDSSYEKEAE